MREYIGLIGKINLLWHDKTVSLSLCAQDRWIEYQKQGLKIRNKGCPGFFMYQIYHIYYGIIILINMLPCIFSYQEF